MSDTGGFYVGLSTDFLDENRRPIFPDTGLDLPETQSGAVFRDMGRIDCEGALAIMRGEPPQNVVNREVLDRPGFRRKLERYRDESVSR